MNLRTKPVNSRTHKKTDWKDPTSLKLNKKHRNKSDKDPKTSDRKQRLSEKII